jgi:hypothetical protein
MVVEAAEVSPPVVEVVVAAEVGLLQSKLGGMR